MPTAGSTTLRDDRHRGYTLGAIAVPGGQRVLMDDRAHQTASSGEETLRAIIGLFFFSNYYETFE